MPSAFTDSMLPEPDDAQRAHSASLLARLRAQLAGHNGWLPFDVYVQQALYAPGLGYYSAGAQKFGANGDFITAPELSPLFAGCIARQFAAARPGNTIFELGAGSGALAGVLLQRLEQLGALPDRYLILEVSADLRQRQQQRLAQLPRALADRVSWLERLPEQPVGGLILANEVADALPFKRARWLDGLWREQGFAMDAEGRLQWMEMPPGHELQQELQRLFGAVPDLPDDFAAEVCTALDPWIASLAATLQSGALLLFDYGLGRAELYHRSRRSGTLRCHYRHRAHDDPFFAPGLQDITAWVDFTRIAEAASEAGLDVAGFTTQAAFLLAGGLEQELAQAVSVARSTEEAVQRRGEAQRLLLPGEMGETFKAMLLTRGEAADWTGFMLQDLRRLL